MVAFAFDLFLLRAALTPHASFRSAIDGKDLSGTCCQPASAAVQTSEGRHEARPKGE